MRLWRWCFDHRLAVRVMNHDYSGSVCPFQLVIQLFNNSAIRPPGFRFQDKTSHNDTESRETLAGTSNLLYNPVSVSPISHLQKPASSITSENHQTSLSKTPINELHPKISLLPDTMFPNELYSSITMVFPCQANEPVIHLPTEVVDPTSAATNGTSTHWTCCNCKDISSMSEADCENCDHQRCGNCTRSNP